MPQGHEAAVERAGSGSERAAFGLQAGFSHHLTKPVQLHALQAMIRDAFPAAKAASAAGGVTTSPVR